MTIIYSGFSIIECSEESRTDWDAFVGEVHGTYCHLFGWKGVIERAYGLQTHYLAFKDANRWLAVLPVVVMPKVLGFKKKAVSMPYCNYGGLLATAGVDIVALKKSALHYLASIGVTKIELRDIAPGMADRGEVTMLLNFPENSDLLWKQLNEKVRSQVRKAQRSSLELRWGVDQVEEFYTIYMKNMGRLGTPVHSKKFIEEILTNFAECVDILTVRLNGRAIGTMLVIRHGEVWADPFASCLREFNYLNTNMLLYWEALQAACNAGAKVFDFGRSHRDSGTYRFKKQWGARVVALNYRVYCNGNLQSFASTGFYRNTAGLKLAQVWRRLPRFVQKKLGPMIRRRVP